jgi:outer membrane protein assembly factor BamA
MAASTGEASDDADGIVTAGPSYFQIVLERPGDRVDLSEFEGKPVVRIDIIGNRITKEHVIRRELDTKVGEPFDAQVANEDLTRLENLGIFSSISARPSNEDGGVAIELEVKEMPWIIPYLAFKYNEEDGFSVGPALSSLNMLGRDIALSGRVLFGGAFTFSVTLSWPWIAANHLSHDLFAAHTIREDPILEFDETSDEVSPWIGTYLGRYGRAAATFQWLRMKSDQDGITLDPDNTDNLIRVGGRIGVDTRDSWRNPTRGWLNELQVLKTGGALGGDGDFWTTDLDIRRFQSIAPKHNLVLGGLWSMQTGEAGVDVPSYLFYRIGGANSVRGYDNVASGKENFGKNQLIGTFAYEYLLLDITEFILLGRWSLSAGCKVALFADVGTAWNTQDELTGDRFKSGFGIGLRPLVPGVDVLRLDLAVSQDGNVRFHFGTFSKLDAQRLRIR